MKSLSAPTPEVIQHIKEKTVYRKADLHHCIQRKRASQNVSVLITLTFLCGYRTRDVVLCVAAKEAHMMLKYMRELQKGMIPMPNHVEEQVKIEQIFNELKPNLECNGARLCCLLDTEKELRDEVAEENFAAGLALGWEIRKELQDAGVLSAHDGEGSGISGNKIVE